ncbi:MAG: hypothetical protein R2693_05830 [Nocardioidaceae bacterium]
MSDKDLKKVVSAGDSRPHPGGLVAHGGSASDKACSIVDGEVSVRHATRRSRCSVLVT